MTQPHDSPIVQTLSRVLIPVVQLYALYVLFHGQVSPGGGFVGGVAFAATLILTLLVYGNGAEAHFIEAFMTRADGLGLLIFAGVGALGLVAAGGFLNYGAMPVPGLDGPARRSLGIVLTMIGVAVDVAVVGISIFYSLSISEEGTTHD